MGRIIIFLAPVLLAIFCTVEVANADRYEVRNAPRWLWVIAIICLPVVGPLGWLIFGRPKQRPNRRTRLNPDDDPDFLRRL